MKIFLLLLSVLILCADEVREYALSKGLRPVPSDFKTLLLEVDDLNNPIKKEKILLGKKLFFDKNLSLDRTLSCASCHKREEGGADGLATAIGIAKQKNPSHLNSPTLFNTAYSKHLFWDGRAKSLREQASGPIEAPFEMAATPELVLERVNENEEYVRVFKDVFSSGVTYENVTKAIAVYEKTLVTRGRYDLYLEGEDNALSKQEKRGLELFINIGCKSCHYGPVIGGQKMQKFPLRGYHSVIDLTTLYNEKTHKREFSQISLNFKEYRPYPFENRGDFLGKDQTSYFRVPILRNISKTAPYFHNGAVKTLKEAITIMAKYQLGLDLEEEQTEALEAFLKSLDGELVIYDFGDE